MSGRLVLAALVGIGFATTSLAQDFYVVRDATTKKCTVVSEKPTTSTTTIVGDGTVYKTRTEAEGAVKTTKVCTSD